MKRILFLMALVMGFVQVVLAQELYVFSEPASNMPTKSIAIRLTNEGIFEPNFASRTIPELMVGINKNLMVHAQGFFSDMDGKYRLEGGSFYAKYRFLSVDELQSHFRGAVYGRISTSKRPTYTEDINLEGDNAGWQGGLIFTQLVHKLAISGTLGYMRAFARDTKQVRGMPVPEQLINYSLSSGYLLFPLVYKDYKQPNFNLYFEVLGKTNPSNGHTYIDLAPAAQLILNSRTKLELGYRFEVSGNMPNRYNKNMYLARVEFNFFNILK